MSAIPCINHKCKEDTCICKKCNRRKKCGCERILMLRQKVDFCDDFRDWLTKLTDSEQYPDPAVWRA